MDQKKIYDKLRRVSSTLDSIQNTAKYFLEHKKCVKQIVEAWANVFQESPDEKRLTLMYLANEMLQTCRRYQATDFKAIFKSVFHNVLDQLQGSQFLDKYKRILNIWASRNVYDTSFVGQLIELLDTRPETPEPEYDDQQKEIDAKIIEDFNPEEAFNALNKLWVSEQQVELRHRHVVQSRLDLSLLEPTNIWQLKDRERARQFNKDLEEWTDVLRASEEVTTVSLNARRDLSSILKNAELFYQAQSNDAQIVLKAYKTYGARIDKVKELLKEHLAFLPDEEDIAITDELDDAPSPGNTPPHLKDVELEDIDDVPILPPSRLTNDLKNAQADVVNDLLDEDMDVVSDDEEATRERHASRSSDCEDRPYSPSKDNLDLFSDDATDRNKCKNQQKQTAKKKKKSILSSTRTSLSSSATNASTPNSNVRTVSFHSKLPPTPDTPPPPPSLNSRAASAVVNAVGSKNISRLFEPPPPPPPPPPPAKEARLLCPAPPANSALAYPLGIKQDVDMRLMQGKDIDMRKDSFHNVSTSKLNAKSQLVCNSLGLSEPKIAVKPDSKSTPPLETEEPPAKRANHDDLPVSPSGSSTPTQDEPAQENPTSMLQPSNPDSAMTFLSSFIQMNTGYSFGNGTYSAPPPETGAAPTVSNPSSPVTPLYPSVMPQWPNNWTQMYSGSSCQPVLQPVIPNSVCQASGHPPPLSTSASTESMKSPESAKVQRPRAIRHSKQLHHPNNDSESSCKKMKAQRRISRQHSSSSSSTTESDDHLLVKNSQSALSDNCKGSCDGEDIPNQFDTTLNTNNSSSPYHHPPHPNASWPMNRPSYQQFYQPMMPRGYANQMPRFYQ